MLKRHLLAVLLILAFALSACTPQAAPAPATQAPVAEKPTATTAPAQPAATAAPAQPTATTAAAQPAAPTATSAPAAPKYSEAPILAEQVKAGKLPPLDERLPADPFVVGPGTLITEKDLPDWQPGTYGGKLNFAH